MLAEIKLELRDINTRLCRLEKKSPLSAHEGFQLIEDLIPFRYESEISDFNDKLKNNAEMSKLFESFILKIGGDGSKGHIYQALARVINNKCARGFTWKGNKSKPGAKNLRWMKDIKGALCKTHTTLTEADFDIHAAEWFRTANQRYKREKIKRKNARRQSQQAENWLSRFCLIFKKNIVIVFLYNLY